jgi:hypothetical protein
VVPSLVGLLIHLNVLKLVAILKISFNKGFQKILRLFVEFKEEDLLCRLANFDTFYDQEYVDKKLYTPVNNEF